MFKAIWHEKQILIVLLWSVLIFIGYHVMIQPAYSQGVDPDKLRKEICKEHGGVWGAGAECMFKNDNDRKKASNFEEELQDKGLYADYTAEEEASYNQEDSPDKYKCPHYGDGVWNDNTGKCDIKDEEEKTAYEDAVCDNEDAETTNIDLCKSDDKKEK